MRARTTTSVPTVSVVIPCYNYGRYLPAAVGSVLGQPGVHVDVIVVDDASTDNSVAVASSLAAAHTQVRLIAHDANRGHIQTYNDGLAVANGDYVVLLSADDLLAPGSLLRAVSLLEARKDLALAYGYAPRFVDEPPPARTRSRSWTIWSGEDWIERVCRRGSNVVFNPEVVLRGEVLRELGGYDPRLPHSGDLLMWMQAALRGGVGRVNGADQAFYRVHGGNMHLTDFGGFMPDLQQRRRAFEVFFDEDAHDRDLMPLASLARQALAKEALRLGLLEARRGEMDYRQRCAAYEEYALATVPDLRRSRAIREYRRLVGQPRRAEMTVRLARQDLTGRLVWHRWRHLGV